MKEKSLLRLKILDRFILSALAGPFFFGMMIFTLIFVAGDLLFQVARLIIEKGIPMGVVARLFFYRLPEVVALTIPMSCLLSALLGMAHLAAGSEIIALKSLGIPFRRILRPMLVSSFLIACLALSFNELVVPVTSLAADRLMKYEIMKNQSAAVQDKVFLRDEYKGELQRVLYIDQLDTKKGIMHGIMIHEFDKGKMVRTSVAKEGIWKDGEWWIESGRVYDVNKAGEIQLLFRFERQKLTLNLSPIQLQNSTRNPMDMSARELWIYISHSAIAGADIAKLWVTFHLKLAVPWACIILAALGASFGAIRNNRSGSGMSFGVSVLVVFAYYVLMSMCRALGESGAIWPFIAAWTPNLVFMTAALFLARRVD